MSSNLAWEPGCRQKNSLPDQLKFVLRKKYGDVVDANMDTDDLPYLTGLRDAGIDGAQTLIDAIEKYDEISVVEEF